MPWKDKKQAYRYLRSNYKYIIVKPDEWQEIRRIMKLTGRNKVLENFLDRSKCIYNQKKGKNVSNTNNT